ncbi:hypothetical protein [Zavarzinia sp.]|uniref:hypothetical protein n=1 Tax=Zavarzinia sp. TaxID=2027920 RepID=UPI003BB5A023
MSPNDEVEFNQRCIAYDRERKIAAIGATRLTRGQRVDGLYTAPRGIEILAARSCTGTIPAGMKWRVADYSGWQTWARSFAAAREAVIDRLLDRSRLK